MRAPARVTAENFYNLEKGNAVLVPPVCAYALSNSLSFQPLPTNVRV